MITDWLMVIITAVYVVATIFICRANIKSAKATREQLAEAKRQYEEEHRPYISYQFIFERRTWYGMRFTNHGRRVANHVQIKLAQEFINSVSKGKFNNELSELQSKEFTLGIGQSYDIFFGAREFRDNPNKKPISGEILYQDEKNTYHETFLINFEKYGDIFSVNSAADDLHEDMKNLSKELQHIRRILENQDYDKNQSGLAACTQDVEGN